jgi:hypothetical protein
MSSSTTPSKQSETDNIEDLPECMDSWLLSQPSLLPFVAVLDDEVKKDQDSEEELEEEPRFDLYVYFLSCRRHIDIFELTVDTVESKLLE